MNIADKLIEFETAKNRMLTAIAIEKEKLKDDEAKLAEYDVKDVDEAIETLAELEKSLDAIEKSVLEKIEIAQKLVNLVKRTT